MTSDADSARPLVSRFEDEDDIKAHMLRPEHHGGRAIYGLNTHDFVFSPEAERQFWEWHHRTEIQQRRERLRLYQAKHDAFNALIQERRLAVLRARPDVEIVAGPTLRDKTDGAVRVRVTAGKHGTHPLRHLFIGVRENWRAGEPDGGWTKWRTDFRPYQLPYEQTVFGLDPAKDYDIAVIGSNRYARVESLPLRVNFTVPRPTSAVPQVAGDPDDGSPPPKLVRRTLAVTWGKAWGRYLGAAPGRECGNLQGAGLLLPVEEDPREVTALFLLGSEVLRLQLDHGTPAWRFPDRVLVSYAGRETVFEAPGGRQTFGLGEARDYRRNTASNAAANTIAQGWTSEVILEWPRTAFAEDGAA